MPKITPCLWFDTQAEEAARFYVEVFPNSRLGRIARYTDAAPEVGKPEGWLQPGQVLTVEFELDGAPFTALNGGPVFKFSEAVSFQIDCRDQAEVDFYWERLLAGGGAESQCGWLKDRFGLFWQVVPRRLAELLSSPDPDVAKRVTEAMLKMSRLDVAALEAAARA